MFGRPDAPGYPDEAELVDIYGVLVHEIERSGWHVTEDDDIEVDAELELLRFDASLLSDSWDLEAEAGQRYVGTAFPPSVADAQQLAVAVLDWLSALR